MKNQRTKKSERAFKIVGIGFDAVAIEELRRIAEAQDGLLERIFDKTELEFCRARQDPWPGLAARFAAKEAVMKAIGTGWAQGVDFLDIVTFSSESGQPRVFLRGIAKQKIEAIGGDILVSLCRAGGFAFAVALLQGRLRQGK